MLSSVGPSTQGSYHCIAVNQRGEDKATALITVFGKDISLTGITPECVLNHQLEDTNFLHLIYKSY